MSRNADGKNVHSFYVSETVRITLATSAGVMVAAILGSTSHQGAWLNVLYDITVLFVGSVALLRVFWPQEAKKLVKQLKNSIGRWAESLGLQTGKKHAAGLGGKLATAETKKLKIVAAAAAASIDVPVETVEVKTMRLQKEYPGLDLEEDVEHLLRNGFPGAETRRLIQNISRRAKDVLAQSQYTDLELHGYPITNLVNNEDVPSLEVSINIVADLPPLIQQLASWSKAQAAKYARGGNSDTRALVGLKPREATKKLLRVFADSLIRTGFFLYHYCVYNADIPKVSLRVPAFHAGTTRDVFVNVFLNNAFAQRQEDVSNECARLCPCGSQFAFFVRRWARDRGIAFAIKGHFSSYAWTVLALHYLQQRPSGAQEASSVAGGVIQLFTGFIDSWRQRSRDGGEAVVTPMPGVPECLAGESPGDLGREGRLPVIVDPYVPASDLGATMTAETTSRFWEELDRADEMLSRSPRATLAELLKHWVPPDGRPAQQASA